MPEIVECPVVDLGRINCPNATEEDYRSLGKELVRLLQEIGFLYFVNHGFDEDLLNRLHSSAGEFFDLDMEVKKKYTSDITLRGYAAPNTTFISEDIVGGDSAEETPFPSEAFRESYSSNGREVKDGGLPDIVEVRAFQESFDEFIRVCKKLAQKLFKAFELGLDIPEGTFAKLHQGLLKGDTQKDTSVGRSLSYPPFKKEIKEGTVILLEHYDVDAFTFLYQDDVGGLEVLNKNKTWQPVTPKKNAIVFNTGNCFEVWTAGKIIGTKHRVVVAPNTAHRKVSRRSYVFFASPDKDAVIKPLGASSESEKYQPILFSKLFVNAFKGYLLNDITATP